MRRSKLSGVLDELDEDFAPVSKKVTFFLGDIVFRARTCEERIEHLTHHIKVFHRVVILNTDKVIKRYLLNA